jgi:transcriptional regulator with XRE-family HTH domain
MEVYEKINYLIREKGMNKNMFTNKLLALQPRLKSTGEIPSPSTINGYLYGRREIKIELIPYIAEVLGVEEQVLFDIDLEYANGYNITRTKEVREIIALLPYAPTSLIEQIREQLQKYKALHEESLRAFSSVKI